jgi:hypothetical protein
MDLPLAVRFFLLHIAPVEEGESMTDLVKMAEGLSARSLQPHYRFSCDNVHCAALNLGNSFIGLKYFMCPQ